MKLRHLVRMPIASQYHRLKPSRIQSQVWPLTHLFVSLKFFIIDCQGETGLLGLQGQIIAAYFLAKSWICLEGQINSLQFLPATPSSQSRTLEELEDGRTQSRRVCAPIARSEGMKQTWAFYDSFLYLAHFYEIAMQTLRVL